MQTTLVLALAIFLLTATVLLHYESFRATSALAARLSIPPRTRILVVITGILVAHLLEIALYAFAFFAMQEWMGIGAVAGATDGTALDYFYFSNTTYTTLGVGDVHPIGPLRLVAGVESLNGLLLIGWSASFTYLAMGEFWTEQPD
jgi:hypothetical protein